MDRLMQEQRERLLFALSTALPPALQIRVEQAVHQQLLLAMQPLAQALERQDLLLQVEMRKQTQHLLVMEENLRSLLEEVLQGQQPTAEQQLLVNGRWIQPSSRRSSQT